LRGGRKHHAERSAIGYEGLFAATETESGSRDILLETIQAAILCQNRYFPFRLMHLLIDLQNVRTSVSSDHNLHLKRLSYPCDRDRKCARSINLSRSLSKPQNVHCISMAGSYNHVLTSQHTDPNHTPSQEYGQAKTGESSLKDSQKNKLPDIGRELAVPGEITGIWTMRTVIGLKLHKRWLLMARRAVLRIPGKTTQRRCR